MTNPSRIAFGSCNHQDLQNNLWSVIEARSPAAFVFGGDAIYSDTRLTDWSTWPPRSRTQCATPQRLKNLYQQQRNDPNYRRILLDENITVLGTYDDHDYGCNNADSTFEYRRESAEAFVDFIEAPRWSAIRQRALAGHGVYGVKLFDFARPVDQTEIPESVAGIDPDVFLSRRNAYSTYSNRTVAVFVLDVRTNKTPWKRGSDAYRLDLEGDFLGERQWQWLETALRRSRAQVNVIVNGLQVHGNRFPSPHIAEGWDKFPRAQQRLFDAVMQDGVNAPILISGDVHMTQLMRKDCVRQGSFHESPRPLVELTTSGMTHSWGTLDSPVKSNPQAKASLREWIESLGARYLMTLMHKLCPWTEIMVASGEALENGGGEGARTGLQYSLQKNVGELEFDWDSQLVNIRVFGEHSIGGNPPLLMASMSMNQLSGYERMPGGRLRPVDFQAEGSHRNATLPGSEWICVNHRGIDTPQARALGLGATAFLLVTPPGLILVLVLLTLIHLLRPWYAKMRRKTKSRDPRYEVIPPLKPVH